MDQFTDIFSAYTGLTHLVQNNIEMLQGVVVRQQPYCVPEAHC